MAKAQRGFKYHKRTKDDLKERANMKGGNYDTIFKPKFKEWKPKEGKNRIRILPPSWDDARHYGLDIFVNYSIGPDNQSYLSLSKHGLGNDPLAEAKREAEREGDKELAKALRPSQRILYWIIDRMDEDEGPLLWAAPFTFDKSLSNLCIDEDTKEVIFIDDPEKGRDVRFYREGNGLNTKYDPSKMKILEESTIHEDEGVEQDWLDFISENPLPDVLNFHDYDHIKATFDGQAGRKDDEDEDPKPRGRRAAPTEDDDPPPRSRRSRPESDPEDEVEDKPAPRGRSRQTEPSEGDEADEKPRNTRTRSREVENEDDPPRSRRAPATEDDDEGGSLRERIARRRSRNTDTDD